MLRRIVTASTASLCLALSATVPASAIVGGSDAALETAPYQVSVREQGWSGNWSHICSGFLRASLKVVVPAHCVDGKQASKLQVQWGGANKDELPFSSTVTGASTHEKFDRSTRVADVAVLTLGTPATEAAGVRFARLADQDPAPDTELTVSGWGATQPDTTALSTSLQTLQEQVDTSADCRAQVGDELQEGMFCGRPAPRQSLCQGDLGDPAAVDGIVVGMATSKFPPCGNGTDDVYTSTAAYKTWIESQ